MNKRLILLTFVNLILLSLFWAPTFSAGQTVTAPKSVEKPTPTPAGDSINRPTSEVYTGDLSNFDNADRAEKLQIERVMDILKIEAGKSVADIGAGSGWFTMLAAKRTGEKGKVFAVEINPEYINHINERARKENLSGVTTILGQEDNPNLTTNSIDAVLILNTYHEIAEPVRFLRNLRQSLKKDALVGIIDRNGKGDDHGVARESVIEEAKRAGFGLVEEHDFVKTGKMDYFLVFQVVKTEISN
jgi:cyclopropane fatty-acyl-phospholipid synthase-like methyltransferase